MKKFPITLCIVASSLVTSSQTNIGLKAGLAMNTFTQTTDSEKPFMGIQAAAVAKIEISDRIFLQPAIGYYPKGKKRLDETIDDEFGNPVGSGDATYRIDYIELSAPFQYMLRNVNTPWLAGLGPFVSYALGGRSAYKNVSGLATGPKNSTIVFGENGSNRADFGLTFLFSTVFSNRWVLSLNYDQGLTNTDRWSKEKTMSAGLTIGYFLK